MIRNLLNQTCHIARSTGEYSITGDEEYADPVEYQCRIDYDTRLAYNVSGVEVPSIATVFLDTDISEHDWIYLDSEYIDTNYFDLTRFELYGFNTGDSFKESGLQFSVGTGRKPISVKHLYDKYGAFHHCEVAI